MTSMYTFLMVGKEDTTTSEVTWSKLCDVKNIPSLMGAPEQLDKTTLSDSERHYENGLKSSDAWEFTANYDETMFQTLLGMEGVRKHFAVWFGGTKNVSTGVVTPTGVHGQFSTQGYLSVTPAEAEVNVIQDMTITIAKDADVAFAIGTA